MKDLIKMLRNHWDRTAAILAVVGGFGALLAGWSGARDSVFAFRQIPYLLSGGLVGVCLVGVGTALWLSADLRDEWRKLDLLDDKLESIERSLGEVVLPQSSPGETTSPRRPLEMTADRRLRVTAEN